VTTTRVFCVVDLALDDDVRVDVDRLVVGDQHALYRREARARPVEPRKRQPVTRREHPVDGRDLLTGRRLELFRE
jgi:hypothetical protein